MSLNNPQNLENCLSKDFNRIKRRVNKIVTLLPENALTPIPKKDIKDGGLASKKNNKDLKEAERTAVFIRRMEYSTTMKRQMDKDKNLRDQAKKVALIQGWWKTMFKIIKIQKNIRGYLFRKKLMNHLDHQEKLLKFITEFDNIYHYHLFKGFMDNLKQKRDYEKSKLMEKCEDFNEKMDNLEKLRDKKNFKNCFKKWRDDTKKQKEENLNNLVKKLNDCLEKKKNEDKKNAFDKIKGAISEEEKELNNKMKDFQLVSAKKIFKKKIIKPHKLNKMLNNIKNKKDDENKKYAFDKLKNYNNILKGLDKLKNILEHKMKKDSWNDMKTMDFVDKLDDLINKHNNQLEDDAKKQFMDNLKDLNNKKLLKDNLKKWKDFNDEQKKRMKILNKLKRHKLNEIRKKEAEEKKKLVMTSGVNDFELISDKKSDDKNPIRKSQIFISTPNDINVKGKQEPKFVLSHVGQNFSFIPTESTAFESGGPAQPSKTIEKNIIPIQLNEIDSFLKNKSKNDEKEKKEIKYNKISGNNLKKNKINGNNLKEYFDGWRDAAQPGKEDSLDKLKERKNDLEKCLDDLDNLLLKKYKEKFLNNLKPKKDIDKLINSIQKYVSDLKKATDILDKLLKDKNDKAKKDALDKLKNNDRLGKAAQKLENLIKNKLKDDTFKKLKTMDFVDILKNLKKKHDDKDKDMKLKKLMNNLKTINNLKKYFDKWKDIKDKGNVIKKFKKQKILLHTIKKFDDNKNNKNLKKYFDKWKDNAKPSPTPKSKRISRRVSPKKFKKKNRNKNKNKNLLRDAFNKWKNIVLFSPTKNVLDQIKNYKLSNDKIDNNNKNNSLFPKYKRKVLQVLFNMYRTHINSLIKKYFDKWRKESKLEYDPNINKKDIQRYKKKPKFLDNDKNSIFDIIKDERESFRPRHYLHKPNLYSKRPLINYISNPIDNIKINLNEKFKPYDNNYNYMPILTQPKSLEPVHNYNKNINVKKIPYNKKSVRRTLNYDQSPYKNQEDYYNDYDNDYFKRYNTIYPNENHNEIKDGDENYYGYFQPYNDKEISRNNNNINIEENFTNEDGESSSFNESFLNGMLLIENRKSIRQPRDYTSQSFFIDKDVVNGYKKDKNNNQLPMKMKGDFVSLIEQNPKILTQKNPRIQVTNATCDLNQILNDDNKDNELTSEIINDEIEKLENSFIINKNKVLNKVIQNCDKDVYSSKKPFYSKKDQWYSVSIPLKDNEAKWEFLNNIRGERDKNTLNKFELIQKEIEQNQNEENGEKTFNTRTFKPLQLQKKPKKDNSYKLQEMNYSQFYRTPIHSMKDIFEDEKNEGSINDFRIPRAKKSNISPFRLNLSHIRHNSNDPKNSNTSRTRGKLEGDHTINTIEINNDE
jgi:hypothetical protein